MTALDKELEQLQSDIYSDVYNLVDKYLNITSLDIPENDEQEAKRRIVSIIKQAINEIEE
ncbi:MAG: hypothetical protein WCY75_02095 [Sulfurimonadaceae bacterium]|jgi:hypothetical protein|nr:hypothetical protein [Arcobacteraceae bacterium]MDX9795517.1 hypothetical protein [Arcobacteraceae bacterium]